jgi:glycine betaine/choline ABC-type transport system substrate-binding protein
MLSGCTPDDAIVVGSKNFTEQNILGEIVAQELEARGVPVERRFHLGGTFVCHHALMNGEIDVYAEYTGTALTAILELPVDSDAERVYQTVRSAYQERWNLEWASPLGFENTFALVVRRADAEAHGLVSIADLAPRGADLVAGFGPEFMARPDGYPGLQDMYGLEFGSIRQLDLGLMYRALADHQIDVAVANSTDGQIAGLDLLVLEDDRDYFPPYQAAAVSREVALEREPRLAEVLTDLAGAISPETMRNLNYEVDVEGRDVSEVVRSWRDRRAGMHRRQP